MRKKLEKMKLEEKVATEAALTAVTKRLNNSADHFIQSLLTERERLTIGRRVLIANLILSGFTQMEINQKLSVSPNTYSKIKRWIDDELPNFEATNEIERARSVTKYKARMHYPKPLTFAAMRKNYPLDFLLFNLSKELIDRLEPQS